MVPPRFERSTLSSSASLEDQTRVHLLSDPFSLQPDGGAARRHESVLSLKFSSEFLARLAIGRTQN